MSLPKSSFFLLGPRGTGKSTWVRAVLPEAHFIDLLDEARYQRYLSDPGSFAMELAARPRGSTVIVDEIQRLPGLLNEIHRAIEGRRLRFALTGSSARKLRRGGTNLLGGRALELSMFPFVPEELAEHFSTDSALERGTLPLIWASEEPERSLEAYARTYLKEGIQAEALVRNLPGFSRFLPVAALFHGQVINVASLARDAGVARTTIDGFLAILEDTLIAQRLPACESRLRVRERRHPKLYFFDPGVARTLKRRSGAVLGDERGSLLEGFVLGMLRFYMAHRGLADEVRYWAPADAKHTEVDFVLTRGSELLAIEVRSAKNVRASDFVGLKAIAALPGLTRRVLVYAGEVELRGPDSIEVWPVETLSQKLARSEV
ncbi:MAG: ATP-binding protein [Deltaproteobacteria bacterium]|nr:ATP-binding protein [Deltaproteobacteria bacterium]